MQANILIVDDEEGMRYTLRSFLVDEGHQVFTAASYDEALPILDEIELDLVFSDIVLGGRTGIDVLRATRERRPGCPVVMITGYPDVETAAEAVRLGAFDYIAKPVVQETLLRTTKLALQHKAVLDLKEKRRSNLESFFRDTNDAVISLDHQLVVLELNDSARRLCSHADNTVGRVFGSGILHCGGRCLEVLHQAIADRHAVQDHRLECRPADGTAHVLNLSVFPLFDRHEVFSGAVMVLKDETLREGQRKYDSVRTRLHNIVGASAGMQEIYDLIESLRNVSTTVLVLGESGTGKELIAEALHHSGERSQKPFVKVNCGALTDNLLESELFGHVRGAFTGAVRDKVGRFQRADGGTIFLDEIGNISPRMQSSLLRVLQEREFERVGDATPIRVDVRVIAATNQDLVGKIQRGEFREDLYYRLKVMQIAVPPLRDRLSDMDLLVEHFLRKFNQKFGKHITGVSQDVLQAFLAYPWPGNVRELEHAMEHAFIVCGQKTITLAHLPAELNRSAGAGLEAGHRSAALNGKADPSSILAALQLAAWNKAKAARILGISKRTMFRKIKEYNLTEPPAANPT